MSVVDEQGKPIENVAVYATSRTAPASHGTCGRRRARRAPTAIMDQQNHQFVPHVLVVQTGTAVTFPNSDNVSHHVYSFSATKPFELPLYKGDVYPPVMFDKPGIVVVGCNIHDSMLGYIASSTRRTSRVTNEQGVALIDGVPSGDYAVEAWTPRVRPRELARGAARRRRAAARPRPRFASRAAWRRRTQHGGSSLTWDRY